MPRSREKESYQGRRKGGHCSHGTRPSSLKPRDAGAPAVSEGWRKAQKPPGRLGGGAGSTPAAEGEGDGSAHRPELEGKRQTPATGSSSSSPLATGRGSHAPCSGVTAPGAQKEAWGVGVGKDESSRPTSPSRLAPAPSQNPAAASRRSRCSSSDSLSPLRPAEERRRTGRETNENAALTAAVR